MLLMVLILLQLTPQAGNFTVAPCDDDSAARDSPLVEDQRVNVNTLKVPLGENERVGAFSLLCNVSATRTKPFLVHKLGIDTQRIVQ